MINNALKLDVDVSIPNFNILKKVKLEIPLEKMHVTYFNILINVGSICGWLTEIGLLNFMLANVNSLQPKINIAIGSDEDSKCMYEAMIVKFTKFK